MNIGVLGGTGNVGRRTVLRLLAYPQHTVGRVVLLNRRAAATGELPAAGPRLVEYVIDMADSDGLEEAFAAALDNVQVLVSTIGIGSGKGSAELFRRVEVDLATAFARAGKRMGAGRAVLLTSVGANINSRPTRLNSRVAEGHYFHLKGLVEQNFTELGFADGLAIFRPAGLLGTSHMPAAVDWLLPALDWLAPPRWRSIHIEQLACAIADSAVDFSRAAAGTAGAVSILEGKQLFALLEGRRWQRTQVPIS